jgi:23S rRNA (guanosine2251-2'-O)-methyltransferase
VSREFVYGRRPVREALRGRRDVLELWATERALKAEPWLRDAGVRPQAKPERELSEAAATRDHQGVLAWAEPYRYADAYELAASDSPAVCRASAGAVEHLPVAVVKNMARYLAEVKGPRLWAWAAAGDGETRLWQADLTGGVALVLGAEGKGLRPLVRRTCDAAVAIPLAGRVDSLNVSVAAAVLLYEARRQRDGA